MTCILFNFSQIYCYRVVSNHFSVVPVFYTTHGWIDIVKYSLILMVNIIKITYYQSDYIMRLNNAFVFS